MTFETFFRKAVLVARYIGFEDSCLIPWLYKYGANVHSYSLSPISYLNNYAVEHVACAIEIVEFIRNHVYFEEYIHRIQLNRIFHLEKQSHLQKIYSRLVELFEANIPRSVYLKETSWTLPNYMMYSHIMDVLLLGLLHQMSECLVFDGIALCDDKKLGLAHRYVS